MNITVEWNCTDGHENAVTFESSKIPEVIISDTQNWYADDKIACGFCDNEGTDSGLFFTSDNEYIRGVLDTLDYQEHS